MDADYRLVVATITEVTRRAIVADLARAKLTWFGDVGEVEFLSRLFELHALPSTDGRFPDAAGDIWQHRVNNDDWPDDWVFTDTRFNLIAVPDAEFLRFLSESIHPAIRVDDDVRRLVKLFNDRLRIDGWEYVPIDEVSGRIVHEARRMLVGPKPKRLVLDYRSGGSSGCELGDPVDATRSHAILASARAILVAGGDTAPLSLLDRFPFELVRGTNSFGDFFFAANASVSADVFSQHAARDSREGAAAKLAARTFREALGEAGRGQPEMRFVTLTLAENIVRGAHGEYEFEADSFDSGGFATIHRARTRAGTVVALKQLYARDEEAVARLRREIQEQSRIQHPSVMPILDHDSAFRWFVMPMADENLAAFWNKGAIKDDVLLAILRSVAEGLRAAHGLKLVHRDVSPRNVLRIRDQWVVADWGVVRRPPGLTTMVRTQGELGSNGFAAPELFQTAHDAGPPADVYALGRIAAWAVTKSWPEQNVPLYPSGPWRQFVRRTTEHAAARRVQDMGAVLSLLGEVERELRAQAPSTPAAAEDRSEAFLEMCLTRLDDADLFLDRVHRVEETVLRDWIEHRPNDVTTLVESMEAHVCNPAAWGERGFDAANVRIAWLRRVATLAVEVASDGIIEDVATSLLRCEAHWERFPQRHATRAWLESLTGEAARTVARVLSRERTALRWLLAEGWFPEDAAPPIRAVCEEDVLGAGES